MNICYFFSHINSQVAQCVNFNCEKNNIFIQLQLTLKQAVNLGLYIVKNLKKEYQFAAKGPVKSNSSYILGVRIPK